MAIDITVSNDNNHTIASSKPILSRQSEIGEVITFVIPSALNATHPLAWIHIQQPDGQMYYIDNGSASGFTYDGDNEFEYAIGSRDTMLSTDGKLGIQIVLRDAVPPNQTLEWRSRVLWLTVEGSITADEDSAGSTLFALGSGTMSRIADVAYSDLADGDLLYRDTTSGQWKNVTLVAGLHVTATLNKTSGTLTLSATGDISPDAEDVLLADSAGRYAATQVEDARAEIAGAGRTVESLAHIGLLSSLTTTEKGTVVGSVNEINTQLAQKPNEISGLDGTLDLTGGQIKFPATQVPSSDANTLDDYEEGTFTPTTLGETTAGVGTYNAQEASYVKIGKLVYFSIYVSTTDHTGSGNYLIGGLPFIARNQCSATIGYCLFLTYSGTLGAWIMKDSSRIVLLNTVSGANISITQLDATSEIMLCGCYVRDEGVIKW